MNTTILIVPSPETAALAPALAAAAGIAFGQKCAVSDRALDVAAAFDPFRRQYRSTALLTHLEKRFPEPFRVLGVTSVDLFVPVLTFVFGEAQVNGRCAVVSSFRLDEQQYGLPPDPPLLVERLTKEAIHELGHTFGLRHCDDWTCVMHSGEAVERLDLKTARLCERCQSRRRRGVTRW